jgi:hypothetical protein
MRVSSVATRILLLPLAPFLVSRIEVEGFIFPPIIGLGLIFGGFDFPV